MATRLYRYPELLHIEAIRTRDVNISNMALIGRIPRNFGNLTFLVSLDLGSNNFQGNLPQEMAHLRRLKFEQIQRGNSFLV
ncbi:hypothetical protein KY289_018635 [Solanum tuberosum]|nr:hypothetical protein KY284_015764 [Solanum tuberosum]KAH0691277.1 hypothetical protein KY289_018635 [Solanum tuberosum]